MGNEIGKFSLEHVSNVYIQDANGQISNQTNWKGTSDVAGIAYGTLIFGPNDLMEMNSLIQYKPISSDNSGKIKFNNNNPYVLEFDINSQDRGFTQNMVGGQIIIPRLYKVTGNEDVTNEDLADETDEFDESSTFIDAYLTDESVLDYSTQDLIDIIQTGTEEEQFYADQALQERAADRDY